MSDIPNTEQENLAVAESTPVVDSPSTETVDTAETVETDKIEISDRATSRQQELANRLKDSEIRNANSSKELENLRNELKSYKETKAVELSKVDDSEVMKLDSEPSYEQLDRYIEQKANQLVNKRLVQRDKEENHLRKFEKGVSLIESKFKELNPDSDSFDPELSSTVTKLYRKSSKVNPEIDVREFVEGIMAIKNSGASKAVSEVKKETVLQEAESAITPSSEKVDTKSSEEQLIEALKSGKLTAKEAEKFLQ